VPYIAIPAKPSGHQPQGGIDAAMSKPESIGKKPKLFGTSGVKKIEE
jgi:hypothetical protein